MLLICLAKDAIAADAPGFVGSQACGACHSTQMQNWLGSDHSWALRMPSPESVLGDFNDAHFEHKGLTSRFFRKDGHYFVETAGADGKLDTFQIKYAVGVAPLQQYLVELDRGRLQALDIAWDTIAKRWFHLYPDEEVGAGNGLHWTGPYKNWQARCAVCHQTNFRKNYDPQARSYHSQWSELTVGCEACHGPGEAHAAWAQTKPAETSEFAGVDAHGWLHPSGIGKQAIEADMCGPCHSRRQALGPNSASPQAAFGDHYALSMLENRFYFPDGQQQDEVYILGSFLQSRMHEKGVTCTNCHDPHSGGLVATGNAVCTQCHNETGRAEFPTLKPRVFDAPAHHHHSQASEAAQCVSCHMPKRDYMVIDGRRDHFFRVPDPLLSRKAGSPDACLSCHTGQSADWAAAEIREWAPNRMMSTSSYGDAFTMVRRGGMNRNGIERLMAVARDTAQPEIARATALHEIADATDGAIWASLADLLSDRSALVRQAAIRLWRIAPVADRVEKLQPLLRDAVASVRVAAALELANVASQDLPIEKREALEAGLAELKASMAANADFPEGQMAIGGLALTTRNWDAARTAFAEATLLDPQLVDAWLVRARIADALGDAAEAMAILTSAYDKNAGDARIATDLAALHANHGQDGAAISVLREAVTAHPQDQDVRIALAGALLRTGELAAAQRELDVLRLVSPDHADVLVLSALRELFAGDAVSARKTVRRIAELYPHLPLPSQLQALSQMP